MLDKKTVFILGAGASCPYGYPSGAHLREYICLPINARSEKEKARIFGEAIGSESSFDDFRKKFEHSSTKSIDLFMARNPKLAQIGKCIIAYEIFTAEHRSKFREQAELMKDGYTNQKGDFTVERYLSKKDFQGSIWYEYLFDRLTAGLATNDNLPDFSDGNLAFITFNYDRSLEYFLYDSLYNSFTEIPEPQIVQCLKQLKILHVYGQIAPLKWQDDKNGVDYRPPITAPLLKSTSVNIRTIHEEQKHPELIEAYNLIKQAGQIFFLGFSYATENMKILGFPEAIPARDCQVYGTAFGLNRVEIKGIYKKHFNHKSDVHIEAMDCLELLRNYLN
jgi:hypothetical protein